MVFCAVIWKIIKLRRAINHLKRVKLNAYRQSIGLPATYSCYQWPFVFAKKLFKSLLLTTCCSCLADKSDEKLNCWDKLWKKGTQANDLLGSFFGLLSGFFITHLTVRFCEQQLNIQSKEILWIIFSVGMLCSLVLAFSEKFRCVLCLAVLQFFTKKGRAALIAFVFVLTLSGPGKNIGVNMEILTESMICNQEMVKNSTHDLIQLAKNPLSVLKNAISSIISSVKEVGFRMKEELFTVMETISDIIHVIKYGFETLRDVVNLCNEKVGTPFDRCWQSFEEASEDCAYQLGSEFSWMCYIVDAFQNICYPAKAVDLLCWLPSLIKEAIFAPISRKFDEVTQEIKKFFDFEIRFNYTLDHELEMSKNFKDIVQDVKKDALSQVQWLLDYFDHIDLVVSGFLFIVFFKALSYHHKFLNSDRHDNYYVTDGMIQLDEQRKKLGKETIFPLRYRESLLYIQASSLALVSSEKQSQLVSIVMVSLSAVQIILYLALDFLMYMFLLLLVDYGTIELDTKDLLGFNAEATGTGFLADMYRAILKALTPIGNVMPSFDTSKCLPYPKRPDFHRYMTIIALLLVVILCTMFQPFILRLRHVICEWIYPHRKLPRDRWLYIHILSARENFLTYARRQIKARVKGDDTLFRVSLIDRLAHTVPCCRCIQWIFGSGAKTCFLCGRKGAEDDYESFNHCPNCDTVYCSECFEDLQKKCTACLQPVEYSDLSDISEESGNISDEESSQGFCSTIKNFCCGHATSSDEENGNYQYTQIKEESFSDSESSFSSDSEEKNNVLYNQTMLPFKHKKTSKIEDFSVNSSSIYGTNVQVTNSVLQQETPSAEYFIEDEIEIPQRKEPKVMRLLSWFKSQCSTYEKLSQDISQSSSSSSEDNLLEMDDDYATSMGDRAYNDNDNNITRFPALDSVDDCDCEENLSPTTLQNSDYSTSSVSNEADGTAIEHLYENESIDSSEYTESISCTQNNYEETCSCYENTDNMEQMNEANYVDSEVEFKYDNLIQEMKEQLPKRPIPSTINSNDFTESYYNTTSDEEYTAKPVLCGRNSVRGEPIIFRTENLKFKVPTRTQLEPKVRKVVDKLENFYAGAVPSLYYYPH